MPISLVHGANYALTEAINIKKVSSIHLPLLRNRMRRNIVGFRFDSLCNVPLITGQGRSWVQHRRIWVQSLCSGMQGHSGVLRAGRALQIRQN